MDKPKNLISEDKMVDILTEMSLVNAARNYNKILLKILENTENCSEIVSQKELYIQKFLLNSPNRTKDS